MADELEALSYIDNDEVCEDCGEVANDSDDGCCKWRRMRGYR